MRRLRILTWVCLAISACLLAASTVCQKRGEDLTIPVIQCPDTPLDISMEGSDAALLADVTAWDDKDGYLRPYGTITRGEVATIFFRLLDENVRDDNLTTSNAFPDVNEDYWANTAISTMARLGVINGRNSGLFDPDANITRAEFAAICARFDDSGVAGVTTFTDTADHWAEDEISRAAALSWIQGYSDDSFRPDQYISRAQAVTMINRVLQRNPQSPEDLLKDMVTWPDNQDPSQWYYLAIQEATNSHDYERTTGIYETWTQLRETPDWSQYE